MAIAEHIKRNLRVRDDFGPMFVSIIVLLNGIFIIAFTLIGQLASHHSVRLNNFSVDLTLAIGLSLIYLSSLLRRRKKTAWLATTIAYSVYLGINLQSFDSRMDTRHVSLVVIFRIFILPGLILLLLYLNRHKYVVRSDGPGFWSAIRLSLIILAVTFVYGTVGFYALGEGDFDHSLSIPASMHYTIDQIGLTTNHPAIPETKRAVLFQDSLTFISIAAIVYVAVSFFQPLKARFADQSVARAHIKQLILSQHDATSEDFFKVWPHDKQYFFDSSGTSGLAYHVYHGVAVILGGPAGKQARFKQLMTEFQYVCYGNDWRPAIIHTEDSYREIYEDLGYSLQKLGQEAVVDVQKFNQTTVKNKYFRNVVNRFKKQGYSYEIISPPHEKAVVDRLQAISDEWLSSGSRSERGFSMGYFSRAYLSHCEILIAKDPENEIQAFINIIPEEFDHNEATYDMLRYSKQSLGNVNDFLLINLINDLGGRGYQRLNLGFCPLSGIEDHEDKNNKVIDGVLGFAFANGDRVYSFSGLHRFKNKYEPVWSDRYLAYQGGIRGFSRSINAVVQVMRITSKPSFADRLSDRISQHSVS
ncbi:MAG TPA: phosphatidylglycerol lysyltransferase domain-containing protein [Candidatus Saccharimonadales bacterium]